MESYSASYSSSNKSAHLSQNTKQAKGQKHAYPFQSHNSLLYSVRKSSNAKPWKKMPVAPMPPTPVKVYKVDPLNFRELVQQLTGAAPEFKPQQQPHHHQVVHTVTTSSAAATSLDVAAATTPQVRTNNWYQDLQSELFGVKTQEITASDGAMTPGFLDMSLSSPSSYSNWCFFPLSSPGTMTNLEPGWVL